MCCLHWENVRPWFWKAFNILLIIILVIFFVLQLSRYFVQSTKSSFPSIVLTGDSDCRSINIETETETYPSETSPSSNLASSVDTSQPLKGSPGDMALQIKEVPTLSGSGWLFYNHGKKQPSDPVLTSLNNKWELSTALGTSIMRTGFYQLPLFQCINHCKFLAAIAPSNFSQSKKNSLQCTATFMSTWPWWTLLSEKVPCLGFNDLWLLL